MDEPGNGDDVIKSNTALNQTVSLMAMQEPKEKFQKGE